MYTSFGFYKSYIKKESLNDTGLVVMSPKQHRPDYFTNISIEGQAVFVYDVSSGKVLYQKNAEVPLPLASITKTMTAIVAEEKSTNNTPIIINRSALDTDGESGLVEGEKWNLQRLLSFTLLSSSNDGAAAVAEAFPLFVDHMNDKAKKLGLDSMRFRNPTGLDIENENDTGGYGSAKDVAVLFQYALKNHPTIIESTGAARGLFYSDSFLHQAGNTNTALTLIPNIIASKTGYTAKAGGNLAVVFDRGLNDPVILVVLGSSYDGRFTDIVNLASSTLKTYNQSQ